MRNTLILLTFSLLLATLAAFRPSDDRASAILTESKKAFGNMSGFTARFRYSIKAANQNAKELVKQGELKYKKKTSSNGHPRYYAKTDDQEIFCNGDKVWIYLRGDNEVSEMKYSEAAGEGMDVESIFKLYESSADARYEASETLSGVACDKIYLAIKDPKLDFNQAYLWIGTKDRLPRKALLIDRRQTRTTLELLSLDTKAIPADAVFSFNRNNYPGVKQY